MNAQVQIDPERLAQITQLKSGGHTSFNQGACAMEAVAYIAREKWSDHPECACPVLASFMRSWNDALPDEDRTRLLLPLIPRLVGTRGSPELEIKRSLMAADWLVRMHTPAWLRLAKLDAQADLLEALPEITSMSQVPSIRVPLEAILKDASAAWAAAGAAAWDAAWAAAGAAAWAAAWAAALDAAWAAALDAAWDAAWDAAGAAAWDALKPTKERLQQSALALIDRMIEAEVSVPVVPVRLPT